jgi:hypothetical protein
LDMFNLTLPKIIIDDAPAASSLHNIPIVSTTTFKPTGFDFLMLGTMCLQKQMRQNITRLFGEKIAVLDIEAEIKKISPTLKEINDRDLFVNLKNKHKNERCFIIGNGPSLTINDLNMLKNEITFAANRIDLAFDSTDWRPAYYSVIDEYVAAQNTKQINTIRVPYKFFPHTFNYVIPSFTDGHYFKYNVMPFYPEIPGFGFDPIEEGFFSGSTVIYFFLQLAFYMGIKQVILIGMDFSFHYPDNSSVGSQIVHANNEKNHFVADYRQPGELWQYPNLKHQKMAFKKAKQIYNRNGAVILNASRHSRLTVFKRIPLGSVLKIKK